MTGGASVDLQAGLWAVALVLLAAAILAVALYPVCRSRRPQEPDVACSTPGSLGRHPLQDPDGGGVRRCACGTVTSVPRPAPHLELVARTDTREYSWPAESLDLARAVGHPTVWEKPDDDPTDVRPLPHIVWPP